MAIYKLGEILEKKNGESEAKVNGIFLNNGFPVVSAGIGIKGYLDKFNRDGEYICISSSGANAGHVTIMNTKFFAADCFTLQISSQKALFKYISYFFLKNKNKIKDTSEGSAQPHVYWSKICNWELEIPDIEIQQQIIDIIEPKEQLFLKFSSCVRIDTLEHAKIDFKNLIDIIEPLEMQIDNISKQIFRIKEILKKFYESSIQEASNFIDQIELINSKWKNQTKYFATNGVGEFDLDYSSLIDVSNERPSRANVSPKKDSFIISKLTGENKVMYFEEEPSEVFSTGFYNFSSKHVDHITGFLLSNDFKHQKQCLSSGTTMQGINNESLSKIKCKKPVDTSCIFTEKIAKLIKIKEQILKLKNELIKFLIK